MENLTPSHAVRYGKVGGVVITRERDETERNYTVQCPVKCLLEYPNTGERTVIKFWITKFWFIQKYPVRTA